MQFLLANISTRIVLRFGQAHTQHFPAAHSSRNVEKAGQYKSQPSIIVVFVIGRFIFHMFSHAGFVAGPSFKS